MQMQRHEEECGTKGDLTEYFTKIDITYVWRYRLDNAQIRFISGQQSADRRTTPIGELKRESYDGLFGVYKELE